MCDIYETSKSMKYMKHINVHKQIMNEANNKLSHKKIYTLHLDYFIISSHAE